MNCESVLERIALGAWEDDVNVASHLAVCPQCRVRVEPAEGLGRRLSDPLLWEEPPNGLRDQVLVAVAGESSARQRRPYRWIVGMAAVLAVVVLAGIRLGDRPDWSIALAPGTDASDAAATVEGWNTEHGTRMVVEVAGLEPTGRDAYYELWLTAPDGRHVSAGTFRTSGRFEMMAGVRRSDYPRLWITREPADDDPGPFPETVLDTPEA